MKDMSDLFYLLLGLLGGFVFGMAFMITAIKSHYKLVDKNHIQIEKITESISTEIPIRSKSKKVE